jgi:hypothetical protein
MATIFPDVEKLVVARLASSLSALSGAATNGVVVATVKPAAGVKPYPAKIVTVRADGGAQKERGLTKSERMGVNVFSNTYANASSLALIVESLMRSNVWGDIKFVETVLSPVRVDNDGPQEQRYMVFEVVVKASSL